MTGLEKSAKKDTVGMIVTVLLYGVGAASVPYTWLSNLLGGGKELEWTFAFLAKIACSVLPIYLIFQFGFGDLFKLNKDKLKAFVFTLPAFLVMVNNLPFVPTITGYMSINCNFLQGLTYCLMCLSIGVLEETVYRGCLLPLFLYKFERSKKGQFWAIISSSAIFGLAHLLNLLGGFSPAVFLQVGYSFLIGATCGFALVASRNIYLPILFHAIFDAGGFLLGEGLASGVLWTDFNIIWTVITSVVFAVFIVVIFIKKDFNAVYGELNLDRVLKGGEEK